MYTRVMLLTFCIEIVFKNRFMAKLYSKTILLCLEIILLQREQTNISKLIIRFKVKTLHWIPFYKMRDVFCLTSSFLKGPFEAFSSIGNTIITYLQIG